MKAFGSFKRIYDEIKDTFEYKLEGLSLEITENILEVMKKKGINRIELAKIMGVSRASVTQFFNNGSNITMKRLLRIAEALDCNININIIEKNQYQEKIHFIIDGHESIFTGKCKVHFPDDYFMMGEYNETACG